VRGAVVRLIEATEASAAARVRHAIALFRSRAATDGTSGPRSSLAVARVLEARRPLLREQLYRKDDDALFEIANRFAIRHQNESQKPDHDRSSSTGSGGMRRRSSSPTA